MVLLYLRWSSHWDEESDREAEEPGRLGSASQRTDPGGPSFLTFISTWNNRLVTPVLVRPSLQIFGCIMIYWHMCLSVRIPARSLQ